MENSNKDSTDFCAKGSFGTVTNAKLVDIKVKSKFSPSENHLSQVKLVKKTGEISEKEYDFNMNLNDCAMNLFVPCYGAFSASCLIFEKMEYPLTVVEGGYLAKECQKKNVKLFDSFVDKCLDFFATHNLVYSDWKFQNIYHNGKFESFKLGDFGSLMYANVEIPNPKNLNLLFVSPWMFLYAEKITPQFEYDKWSTKCLKHAYRGNILPWSLLKPTHSYDQMLESDVIQIFYYKLNFDVDAIILD